MVYHMITVVKVLSGKSSNLTLGWQVHYIGQADNWRGFESEIGDFFFIGEQILFIILEL